MKIRIDINNPAQNQTPWRNAYSERLSGSVIDYHSSHPEAESALLVRANYSHNSIVWRTEVPKMDMEGMIHLCWLGGMAGCQGGPHEFILLAEGEEVLRLRSCSSGSRPVSEYRGSDGVKLVYEHQLTDMCDDHFGLFWLSLPGRFFHPRGLKLELKARDEGSEDWMMVFEYPFCGLPRLHSDPVLIKKDGQILQRLYFGLDSLASGGTLSITAPDGSVGEQSYGIGYQRLSVDIPRIQTPQSLELQTWLNCSLAENKTYTLQPVTPRTIHLLPYSHNDIGYTEIQDRVAELQCANIDKALELIRQSADYPFDAQARWNLEVIWALEIWLDQADDAKRAEFMMAVRKGKIGLNALFANPLTGLCNPVQIMRHLDLAQKLKQQFGLEIVTATVTDIPGFALSLLPALAHNQVKYFSIAPNAGDRTGFIYKGLGDKPFYWRDPSGTRQVLTWVTGAGYSRFHKEKITANGIRHLMNYLRELDEGAYPYELAGLPYTIGGDNGGPDEALADWVKAWNENHFSPHLIISTHQCLFEEFEERHGTELPILSGDMTPYWEDGALSTARETVMVRRAASKLISLQTLMATSLPELYRPEEFDRIWRQIVLWDEHTWGAWNSVSDPDLPFVTQQWLIKQSYALNSSAGVGKLQDELNSEDTGNYALLNSLSCPGNVTGRLNSEKHQGRQFKRVDGKQLLQQQIGSDLLYQTSFSSGWERVELGRSDSPISEPASRSGELPLKVENAFFILEIAADTGAISRIRDKDLDLELLLEGMDLGELSYVPQRDLNQIKHCHNARLVVHETGDLCHMIVIECELAGCRKLELEYLIYHASKRIDLLVRVDKLAVREKESLHLAFPFALEGSLLRYDSACAPLLVETDQLPGMCRNFISAGSYFDLSSPDYGITVATPDTPLFEVGDLTGELPWLERLDNPGPLWSYLMNNIWHTNYKADQEGKCEFRYCLLFHTGFRHQEAFHFAWSSSQQPLFTTLATIPAGLPDFALPLLVLAITRQDGARLLHLVNLSDKAQKLLLPDTSGISLSDPSGAETEISAAGYELAPYEQLFLLVRD